MGRVEVGAGVEVHDQVEPRRHKCLSGKVVRSGEEREFAICQLQLLRNFYRIEKILLTISVEPSLAALRNLFCLS